MHLDFCAVRKILEEERTLSITSPVLNRPEWFLGPHMRRWEVFWKLLAGKVRCLTLYSSSLNRESRLSRAARSPLSLGILANPSRSSVRMVSKRVTSSRFKEMLFKKPIFSKARLIATLLNLTPACSILLSLCAVFSRHS